MQFVVMLCIHGKDQQVQSESSKDFFLCADLKRKAKAALENQV